MRNNRVEIRLADDELQRLNSLRGSIRLRTFARVALLCAIPPTIPEINRIALGELQRIGGNLNQLAKHANQAGGHDLDITDLRKQCGQLRLALMGAKP